MFKLEFDPNNLALAGAIGAALVNYSQGTTTKAPVKADKLPYSTPDNIEDPTEAPETFGDDPALASEIEETEETEAEAEAQFDGPTDEHGVPHHPDHCVGASAKNPYNKTGPFAGHWKRKPGTNADDYSAYIAAQMERLKTETPTGEVDSSAAFGKKPDTAPDAAQFGPTGGTSGANAETGAKSDPQNVGDLMAYISELQAAGRITSDRLQQIYTVNGIDPMDLFDDAKGPGLVPTIVKHINAVI